MRANKCPKLICFIGIDGAGKTTLAKAFVKYAKKKGVCYHYVWANNQPILITPFRKLWRIFFLQGKDMFEDYEYYNRTKKQVVKKYRLFYKLYRFLHTFDYMLWIILRVQLPLIFGRRIVCDRYVYDVAINLSVLLDYKHQKTTKLINAYLRYFPKPVVIFLIDVPEKVAFDRKNDVPSISYLKERISLYRELISIYSMFRLNGTMEIDSLCRVIWKHINTEYQGRLD